MEVVGVTSGASAPEKLVERVCEWFRARGVTEIEPYRLVDEDVEFRLPVELRRELALAETQTEPRELGSTSSTTLRFTDVRRRTSSCFRPAARRSASSTASVSCLIRSPNRSTSSASGSQSRMRSVTSRPCSLRSTFTSWMRSSSSRLEQQLVVERRVERDREPGVARDRPAVAPDALDEHLVRLEHVTVDLEPAAVELLELAALQPLAHVAKRGAELRPEHRQVRLHAQLGRLDLAELDLLDAQLVGDLVGVPVRDVRRARDDEAPQRLAQLELRRRRAPAGRARRRAAPRRSRRAARCPARRARATARGGPTPARPGRGSARGGRRGTA